MSDRLIPIVQETEETSPSTTVQSSKNPQLHQVKHQPVKTKHKSVPSKYTPIQTKLKSGAGSAARSAEEIKSEPAALPDDGDFPRYARASETQQEGNPKLTYRSYVHTLLSRLAYYRQQFAFLRDGLAFDEVDRETRQQELQALVSMMVDYIVVLVNKDKRPYQQENLQELDHMIHFLLEKAKAVTFAETPSILEKFQKELPHIQASKGSMAFDDDVKRLINPTENRNEDFDNTFRKTNNLIGSHPERMPGSAESIKGLFFEVHMSIEGAVTYLYEWLVGKPKPANFYPVMSLLSRPDVRKVENAFVYHAENTQRIPLRVAIAAAFGAKKEDGLKHWRYNTRVQYLYELLDNKGRASTAMRIAISLGRAGEGVPSGKLRADEAEVVRLVEKLEPKELLDFWHNYQPRLKSYLSPYNLQRVRNYVQANQQYAAIKGAAETLGNKEGEDTQQKNQEALLGWQESILQAKGGEGKEKIPFLEQKDRHLEGIIKHYVNGGSKYLRKIGPRGIVALSGNVKDLKKEVADWLKNTIKEEKTYFGGYPLIRKYVLGEKVEFFMRKNSKLVIPKPNATANDLDARLGRVVNVPTRYTAKALSDKKVKVGWHDGDRNMLRLLISAGFDADKTAEEEQPERPLDINADDLKSSQLILARIESAVRQGDLGRPKEIVKLLGDLAAQAKIKGRYDVVNRRQDIFKSIMELSDRMRVEFLSLFVDTPIAHADSAEDADGLVEQALGELEKLLVGLKMLPKQIYEVLGKLKYGSDIGDDYLKLRRSAGMTNYTRMEGLRKWTANEPFNPSKTHIYALALSDKELAMARQDDEMLLGLEFKFIQSVMHTHETDYIKYVGSLFRSLAHHVGFEPKLQWQDIDKKSRQGAYKKMQNWVKPPNQGSPRQHRLTPVEAKDFSQNYLGYYTKYIGKGKGAGKAAEQAKQDRKAQEERWDSLATHDEMVVNDAEYRRQVGIWCARLHKVAVNKNYHDIMLMMMRIWQAGDNLYVPKGIVVKSYQRNPYLKQDFNEKRKEVFLFEVFDALQETAQKRIAQDTFLGYQSHQKASLNKSIKHLQGGTLELIPFIIKQGFRWFRKLDGKDKELAQYTFTGLHGRVLLDEWTDYKSNKTALGKRNNLREQMAKLKQEIKENKEPGLFEQKKERLEELKEEVETQSREIRQKHLPLPSKEQLERLYGGNESTHTSLVLDLMTHLSDAATHDKAFVDTLLAEGYLAEDIFALSENYLTLHANIKNKSLNAGVSWKWLTAKADEYKEGGARLVSAMRNIEQGVNAKNAFEDLGQDKEYFEKTFKDDVTKRQEGFEKTTTAYRKNLIKTIELVVLVGVVPFASVGIVPIIIDNLVLGALYAGTGFVTAVIDKALDPDKETIQNYVGFAGFEAIKASLTAMMYMGSFFLSDAIKESKLLGDSINALNDGGKKPGELAVKDGGRYVGVGMTRSLGKEVIKGLEGFVKGKPNEDTWRNIRDQVTNPASLVKALTKATTNTTFEVTGLNDVLKEEMNPLSEQSKDKEVLDPKERNAEFRANEGARAIRRYINTPLGLDKLVEYTQEMVSNRNPLFKSFEDKSDKDDVQSLAQAHIEEKMKEDRLQDAIDDLEEVVERVNEEIVDHNASAKNQKVSFINMSDIYNVVKNTGVAGIDQLKGALWAIRNNLDFLWSRNKAATNKPKKATDGKQSSQEEILKSGKNLNPENKTQKTTAPKLKAKKTKRRRSLKAIEAEKWANNWFRDGALVTGSYQGQPYTFNVQNVSGRGHNCLINCIVEGLGEDSTQVLNIRKFLMTQFPEEVQKGNYLEASDEIVGAIFSQLTQNANVVVWRRTGESTVDAMNFIAGRGSRVLHIVHVGNHFQILNPR
ncbi:OTU domain-containing protein [Microscilla marina]|uniref:Uncharacterized protein n=1 Tax=Microscilla marina ATCC 23134 TaxID=313606 RepID=A1ZVX4_MICM2|nr:hypothetical protein [Microscilla marina]EAY25456.1 hypothetical protein M23134_00810 [Microscilla marina ATCC 23134]